eukprot:comp23058_c0_seq1/m.36930 comp23058_c0_seq1/g.36930  ORF comp23058_c0_seq1/g.36930 comp23058_c0_seq1/m.36930 type:complete len:776 (-) comp23058_c0_seq1:4-2331(-)
MVPNMNPEELFKRPILLALFLSHLVETCESSPVTHQTLFVITETKYRTKTRHDPDEIRRLFLDDTGYLYMGVEGDEVTHIRLGLSDQADMPEGGIPMLFSALRRLVVAEYLGPMVEQWVAGWETNKYPVDMMRHAGEQLTEAEKEVIAQRIMPTLEDKLTQLEMETDEGSRGYLAVLLGMVVEYYNELQLPPLTLAKFQVLLKRAESRKARRAGPLAAASKGTKPGSALNNKGHTFVRATLSTATYCASCTDLLWGLGLQAFECVDCKAKVHTDKACVENVVACRSAKDSADDTMLGPSPATVVRSPSGGMAERAAARRAMKTERLAHTATDQGDAEAQTAHTEEDRPATPDASVSRSPSTGMPTLARTRSVRANLSMETLIATSPARNYETWDLYAPKEFEALKLEPNGKKLIELQQKFFELVKTEYNYVKLMITFKEVFMDPLLSSSVARERVMAIFANTEDIIHVSIRFLNKLIERQNETPVVEKFSDLFDEMDSFRVYALFCANKALAEDIIKEEKKHYSFLKIVQEAEAHPRCNRNQMEAFLAFPMQRITRYCLLLEDCIKLMREGHSDREPVKELLGRLKGLIDVINKRSGAINNAYSLLKLQRRLECPKENKAWAVDLTDQVREVLVEGYLQVNKFNKINMPNEAQPQDKVKRALEGQKVHAILLTDMMLLTTERGDKLQLYMQPVRLNDVIVRDVKTSAAENKSFYLIIGTTLQEFMAYSPAEKESWIKKIEEASLKLGHRTSDGERQQKELNSHLPLAPHRQVYAS